MPGYPGTFFKFIKNNSMKTYEITFQHEGTTFVVYVENINIESALRIFKETTHYDVVTGIREATWKV